MSVAIRKTKLYVKLVLVAVVVLMVLVVLIKNQGRHADVWFFTEYKEVSVLKLLLVTAVVSIISFWIMSTIFKLWRDWRELAEEAVRQQREQKLDARAEVLKEQEQRIDRKMDRALSDSPEEPKG